MSSMSEGSSGGSSMSESTAVSSKNSSNSRRIKKQAKDRLKALKGNISGGWATQKELNAWYMFDFANSPFYQVLTGVVYPLMLLHTGNFAACPYEDKVVNFNYPGGNFTDTPLKTTCTYFNGTSDLDDAEWGTWTDYVIEDEYIITNETAPGTVKCDSVPFWVPSGYSPEVDPLFRNKTFNSTYYKSADPYDWSWTFLANLSDAEAAKFTISMNSSMMRNVSFSVGKGTGVSLGRQVRTVHVNGTVNGWYYGLTPIRISVDGDSDSELIMSAMINYTDCYGLVDMGFTTVSATAFAGQTISMSVFVQVFIFVSFAGLGDHLNFRKGIMMRAGWLACLAIFLNGFILYFGIIGDQKAYIFCAAAVIIANGYYGLSIIMYNAYLPFLALAHPKMKEASKTAGKNAEKILATYIQVEDYISHTGFAIGYGGGCCCLLISIVLLMMDASMKTMYLINMIVAVWFLVFSIPAYKHLDPRPGPPLPKKYQGGMRWLMYGWVDTLEVVKNIKTLPNTCKYFLCYFWYSDAYNTITHVAILFAEAEFKVGTLELTALALVVPLFCLIGCLLQMHWEKKYFPNKGQKWFIEMNLFALGGIMMIGVLGQIPGMPIGMVNSWELWPFAVLYGLILGPVQSFSRVLMSDLTPPGLEAEFYSAFELTDKGSSWMGPLMCAVLYEHTGTMRTGFWYLMCGCIGPAICLKLFVDVEKGRNETKSLKTMVWVKKRRQHKRKAKKQARGQIGSNVRTSQMSSGANSSNVFSKLKRKSKVAPSSVAMSDTGSSQDSDSDSDHGGTSSVLVESSMVEASTVEASEVEEATMEAEMNDD